MEHPFAGSWGYQVTGYFAPDLALRRRPTTSARSSTRLHRQGIGVILDWVPGALPARRLGARALRRHGALRARRPAPRRAPRLGHARLQLRPARGAQLPARERALLARASTTSTGCASTPSRRCSTSTTRASEGEWMPNELRRPREPRGDRASCASSTRLVHAREPGVDLRRRGVDRLAGRLAADLRSAASASASSGTWAGCTTRSSTSRKDPVYRRYHHHELTFSADLRVQRELRPAALATTRSCTARARCSRRCPATAGSSSPTCASLYALHVGAPGQEAAVHGQRVRAGARVEPRRARSTGTCSSSPSTRAIQTLVRDLNRVYRAEPALWERRLRAARASAGSRRTTPTRNVVAFMRALGARRA